MITKIEIGALNPQFQCYCVFGLGSKNPVVVVDVVYMPGAYRLCYCHVLGHCLMTHQVNGVYPTNRFRDCMTVEHLTALFDLIGLKVS